MIYGNFLCKFLSTFEVYIKNGIYLVNKMAV